MPSLAFNSSASMSRRNVNILTQRSGRIRIAWLLSLHINIGCTFVWLKSVSFEARCNYFPCQFFSWQGTTLLVQFSLKFMKADDAKTMKIMLYLDFLFIFLKGSLVIIEEIDSSITFQKLFEIYVRFPWLCKDYKN